MEARRQASAANMPAALPAWRPAGVVSATTRSRRIERSDRAAGTAFVGKARQISSRAPRPEFAATNRHKWRDVRRRARGDRHPPGAARARETASHAPDRTGAILLPEYVLGRAGVPARHRSRRLLSSDLRFPMQTRQADR